jgi:hypothetical protein
METLSFDKNIIKEMLQSGQDEGRNTYIIHDSSKFPIRIIGVSGFCVKTIKGTLTPLFGITDCYNN